MSLVPWPSDNSLGSLINRDKPRTLGSPRHLLGSVAMKRHPLRKVVDSLRETADEHTYAQIMFGPTAQRPRAREIADLFELAGWKYSFNDTAQETMHGYPYREGIEVIGLNGHLVTTIADALLQTGMMTVRQIVKPNAIDPNNPKYAYAVRQIEIHVGHPPVDAAQVQQQSHEGPWTKANTVVAVVGVLMMIAIYVLGAAAQGWWPF